MSNSRQELYERIRKSSRLDVQLEEMERLGFWKPEAGPHEIPGQLLKRKRELSEELDKLLKEERRFANREEALKAVHERRKAESRLRRKETIARREAERVAKAARWAAMKKKEIVYLGKEVSNGLGVFEEKKKALDTDVPLPKFIGHLELAKAMEITLSELRFLSFHRKVSKTSHYRQFLIPKKAGGTRKISAPMPRLKAAQHWVLESILNKVPLHEAAHGFRKGRSILSNAQRHCGSGFLINMDLKDFFPTITLKRVHGLFQSLGYSPAIATVLALLCTEVPTEAVELDGEEWFVATGERRLPQGAPTSPAITNAICRGMDARLQGIAAKHGFRYTRYADDLSFSTPEKEAREAGYKVLWQVKKVIAEEGFILHPDKLRMMGSGRRMEVTGLVVNGEKPTVPREDVRSFRALLQQLSKAGPDGCAWRGEGERILAKVSGYRHFLVMVDRERYGNLIARADELLVRFGFEQKGRDSRKDVPPPLPEEGGFLKKLFGGFFGGD